MEVRLAELLQRMVKGATPPLEVMLANPSERPAQLGALMLSTVTERPAAFGIIISNYSLNATCTKVCS